MNSVYIFNHPKSMRKFEIVGPWAFENKCLLYGDFQGQGANTLKIIAKTPKNNQDPEKTPKSLVFGKPRGKGPCCHPLRFPRNLLIPEKIEYDFIIVFKFFFHAVQTYL